VREGEGNAIAVRPNVFARKGSGSYYTPDELVGLILEETIEPLVHARLDTFATETEKLRKSRRRLQSRLAELQRLDPARRLLELKVCDPAMGSGHFLVGFVDYLADRVITAMAEAEGALEGYVSPLAKDIDTVRATVLRNADAQGWIIRPEQLDDRHVVRRMVLKRCVYGVDKNPMAVELAKVSLWLHTFTVGAPLGFLDHHLRCGDSLFGCWVRQGLDRAEEGGRLFLHEPLSRAMQATRSMQIVEMLSDAEIDGAHHSAGVFAAARKQTAPLDAFLSLVHALEWLDVTDRNDEAALRFRHRLRQDSGALLSVGRDRGAPAGVVRLRESEDVLPRHSCLVQVQRIHRESGHSAGTGSLRLLSASCIRACRPRPPLSADCGRFRRGQPEHRHRPDLAHAPSPSNCMGICASTGGR